MSWVIIFSLHSTPNRVHKLSKYKSAGSNFDGRIDGFVRNYPVHVTICLSEMKIPTIK